MKAAETPGEYGKTAAEEPLGIDSALEETERRGEVLAAAFRILIAGTMLFAAWSANSFGPAAHPFILLSLLYTILSLIGMALVFGKIFHPSLRYIFVLLDSTALAGALAMQARMHGMNMSHEFSLPIFSLAFVILIHAAMHYRPGLVVLSAGTFITLLFLLPPALAIFFNSHRMTGALPNFTTVWKETMALHDIGYLPLIFLGLAVMLLYFIVRRTRELAYRALLDGQRFAQLTRFFSPKVANRLVAENYEGASNGRRQMAGILFIDIRGFSLLSEDMSPESLTQLLASFRNEVCQVIFEHGGTIDKFIGDAVLAVFGTPDVKTDDAARTARAAFAVNLAVRKWSDRREHDGLTGAHIGIGAHYGEVFAGVIISGQILEHSIIGDAVNVAQRLERFTRKIKANVVLSEEIVTAAGIKPSDLNLHRKNNVTLQGHHTPVTIYHDEMSGSS